MLWEGRLPYAGDLFYVVPGPSSLRYPHGSDAVCQNFPKRDFLSLEMEQPLNVRAWAQKPFLSFDPENRITVDSLQAGTNVPPAQASGVARSCTESQISNNTPLLDLSYDSPAGDFVVALMKLASGFGIKLDSDAAVSVVRHLQLMLEKNAVTNLTSIRNPARALVLHSLDSLLFAKVFQEISGLQPVFFNGASADFSRISCLDMGTGGGFPGIPLACVYPFQMTLLDSVGKKIAACDSFIDTLHLSCHVHTVHMRLEDFAIDHKRCFNLIVARALAPLDVLTEYAEPLVSKDGFLVLSKGVPSVEELDNVSYVSKLCGFELVSRETMELPNSMGTRTFYIYKKVANAGVKLPRKDGEARKHPLADRRHVSRETD